MKTYEGLAKASSPCPEVLYSNRAFEVVGKTYRMRFEMESPYIELTDSEGIAWMQLFRGSNVITSESNDTIYEFREPDVQTTGDGSIVVRLESRSESGGHKEQVWVCHDTLIETYVIAAIEGNIEQINMLGGTYVAPNIFGESMSERRFNSVYNLQPSEMERPVITATESTKITTSGMWKPGRRREFLICPNVLGFNRSMVQTNDSIPDGPWLMASISSPVEAQSFSEFRYDAHEDGFLLRLLYDGTPVEDRVFTSPSLLLHFSPDIDAGLQEAKQYWHRLGHLPQDKRIDTAQWHTGMKYVTWGSQLEQAQNLASLGVIVRARDVLTEGFVVNALETFKEHGIDPQTIVLDDKWQENYGTNLPDLNKWPDLAGFIGNQHEIGRRVLLWMKLFDCEGLPSELCVTDEEGRPIASDPTNPEFLSHAHEQVRRLIAPSNINADGLKLDFLAQLPHGAGLRWHGKRRGVAALNDYMKVIRDAAVSAKKDTLIQAQVVHPWLRETFNQVRLNDTNERHPVLRTMGSRARLATLFLPEHTIDPDGWPTSDKHAWQEYIAAQPLVAKSGVTTHFVDTIKGEAFDETDYKALRDANRRLKNVTGSSY